MTHQGPKDDRHIHLRNAHKMAVQEFRSRASHNQFVECLASALDVYFASGTILDTNVFLRNLSTSEAMNRCCTNGLDDAPELSASVEAYLGSPALDWQAPASVAYVLGRAMMRAAIKNPAQSLGLTLPYILGECLDGDHIAYEGMNDELSESAGSERFTPAADSICEYLASLASNFRQNTKDDQLRFALSSDEEPTNPEQCVVDQFYEGLMRNHWYVFPIAALLSRHQSLVLNLLEQLAHPVLQAFALCNTDKFTVESLLQLLKLSPPVFNEQNQWTKSPLARVILNSIEERLIHNIEHERAASAGLRPPTEIKQLSEQMAEIAAVLLARADGPRLVAEWAAHLLGESIRRQRAPGDAPIAAAILDAVIDQYANAKWSSASQIWQLFGGVNDLQSLRSAKKAVNQLPSWSNWRAEDDRVMPLAIAISFVMNASSEIKEDEDLTNWLRTVIASVHKQPQILSLSVFPNELLLGLLAWPLTRSDRPEKELSRLWHDCNVSRIRARFYRSGAEYDDTYHVVTVFRLGILVLRWKASSPLESAKVHRLLANQLNEIRYCLTPIGLHSWSELIATLAGSAAAAHLLATLENCVQLIDNFRGDDEALATAIVAAACNGADASFLNKAAQQLNVNIHQLAARIRVWQSTYHGKSGGDEEQNEFLKQLLQVADA